MTRDESDCRVTLAYTMLPQHANPVGNVHGGVIMKLIDSAAGVVAIRHARRTAVTASIDRLDFHHPVFIGNLLTLHARLNLVGKSSMEVGVEAWTEDLRSGEKRHVATAFLTFVALDEDGQPHPVPPYHPQTDEDRRQQAMAIQRREARLAQVAREKACIAEKTDC